MSQLCVKKSANDCSFIGAFSYSIGEIRVSIGVFPRPIGAFLTSIGAFPISTLDSPAALTPRK